MTTGSVGERANHCATSDPCILTYLSTNVKFKYRCIPFSTGPRRNVYNNLPPIDAKPFLMQKMYWYITGHFQAAKILIMRSIHFFQRGTCDSSFHRVENLARVHERRSTTSNTMRVYVKMFLILLTVCGQLLSNLQFFQGSYLPTICDLSTVCDLHTIHALLLFAICLLFTTCLLNTICLLFKFCLLFTICLLFTLCILFGIFKCRDFLTACRIALQVCLPCQRILKV